MSLILALIKCLPRGNLLAWNILSHASSHILEPIGEECYMYLFKKPDEEISMVTVLLRSLHDLEEMDR